jgi:hypothetical protein
VLSRPERHANLLADLIQNPKTHGKPLTYQGGPKLLGKQMVTKSAKEAAWDRASKMRGKNPDQYRRDELGNPMFKQSYGKASDMGWEIDHRKPVAKGGTDDPRNLRALNTQANRKKSDKY